MFSISRFCIFRLCFRLQMLWKYFKNISVIWLNRFLSFFLLLWHKSSFSMQKFKMVDPENLHQYFCSVWQTYFLSADKRTFSNKDLINKSSFAWYPVPEIRCSNPGLVVYHFSFCASFTNSEERISVCVVSHIEN